jgi:osmotically inducible lipoprotein OsmB
MVKAVNRCSGKNRLLCVKQRPGEATHIRNRFDAGTIGFPFEGRQLAATKQQAWGNLRVFSWQGLPIQREARHGMGGHYFGGVIMRSSLLLASIAVTCIALSGCGQTPGCRAVTGAGVGAAGGAIIGALTGAPLTGAAIGAVAGGATGALTSPNVVNGPSPCY